MSEQSRLPTRVSNRPRNKKFPTLRPDGTIFRSYRAQPPEPSWGLTCVHGPEIKRRRLWMDLGSQATFAELLSTTQYEIGQPEIVDLEHGGSYVNAVYLARLAALLECDESEIMDDPAAPHYYSRAWENTDRDE